MNFFITQHRIGYIAHNWLKVELCYLIQMMIETNQENGDSNQSGDIHLYGTLREKFVS